MLSFIYSIIKLQKQIIKFETDINYLYSFVYKKMQSLYLFKIMNKNITKRRKYSCVKIVLIFGI